MQLLLLEIPCLTLEWVRQIVDLGIMMGMLCDIKGEQSSPAAAWRAGMGQEMMSSQVQPCCKSNVGAKREECCIPAEREIQGKQLLSGCSQHGNSPSNPESTGKSRKKIVWIVQQSVLILIRFFFPCFEGVHSMPQSKQRKKIQSNVFWPGKVSQ